MPLPVALAQVAIEFIGLVMITTKSHPVQALIPKVPVTSTVQSQTPTSTPIQHHRALLAVPKAAYIKEQSSWPDEHNLGVSGDYQEFELKDERLVIDGIVKSAIIVDQLGLPQLTHPDGADLTTDFKPPFTGAEAVVDMPYGSLTACSARTNTINRIDALLNVDPNGTVVVIRSMNSTTRKIAVDPRRLLLPIYIANVPDSYATTGNTVGQTGPHWMVYYQMIQNPTETAEPKTFTQVRMSPCPFPPLMMPPGGGGSHQHATQTSSMMMMPQAVQRVGTTAPTSARQPIAPAKPTTAPAPPSSQAITPNPDITTAECGSTQWP